MKKLKKWLIGTISAAALAGAVTFTLLKQTAREIYPERAQEHLDASFERVKPEHLESLIYDPDFKEQDNFLRKQLKSYTKESEIEKYVNEARGNPNSHNMCVAGVIMYVGDGKKRPAFARKKLFESDSILTQEDLNNTTRHEDVHAEEERLGYDFGTERKKGPELTKLFNTNQIRKEVINGIGEIPAYATQIEAAEKGLDKVSKECMDNTKYQLRTVTKIIKKGLANNSLTPLERKYAEAKLKKYSSIIEDLNE